MPRNPDWTRDELILALDLYLRSRHRQLDPAHPDLIELSDTLNRLPLHAGVERGSVFRNPNGVPMELRNLLAVDPAYDGRGLKRGNRLVRLVWEDFARDAEGLHRRALAIRCAAGHAAASPEPLVELGEEEFREGRLLT